MDELKEFNVRITETYERIVRVCAYDAADAEEIATSMWNKGEVVLDNDDWIGVDFNAEQY